MELSILLMQQILELFIMIFFGFLLVKTKILTTENSKVISMLVLYVASPCAILTSFAIEFTPDKLVGLGLSFLGAIIVHIIYIPLANILSKIFGFAPIEKATIIYSNSGNLIIPLVGAILGQEWVLYTSGYMVVQTILLWTHAKSLVCNEKNYDLKKIILNINVLAIILGICLFLFQLQLPALVLDTFDTVGGMIGPLAMIVIGMLIGEMNFKNIFSEKRTYLVAIMRLIVFPLITILVLKLTGLTTLTPDASQIFLITVLAASAPAAATITQFAQLYNKHPGYASVMNTMSVIFSAVTMPLMVIIYQLL
ncbi:AEC family transporter [uncultured Thomasclavelia sp.]|uniref:AEC family transporter n=1 Tax=uncultured Thomasclavelia sp. TaxID=3025759 RepID=UPI0025CF9FEE|nr:AEC family transporter [uncultured Thomasclavelia sp.]